MKQAISTFSYDFNKSYYENFWANRYGEMRNSGQFYEVYGRLWESYDEPLEIEGVLVNNGIDVKSFVQTVYNGQITLCMVDALAQAIADIIGSVFGCGIAEIIFGIIDWFTDLFGSFICTATVEALGTECGEKFLNTLKEYRDVEVMSFDEGISMIKYYSVLGPRIVKAIDADMERGTVYTFLWVNYIQSLEQMAKNNEKDKIIYTYFTMMDLMVKRYDIKVSKRFDTWVCNSEKNYRGE